jgi:hypothetical protein
MDADFHLSWKYKSNSLPYWTKEKYFWMLYKLRLDIDSVVK